ncbi:MAG: hypothetical protein V1895_00885 [Parcubacteria group bacterium]
MVHLGTVNPSRNFLRIILILAVASFALVLVVLYFSFARATITLYPKEQEVEIEYQATIDANKEADPSKLDFVPGRLETVEKNDTKKVENVSEKPIPDYAHVTVTIYNQQGGSQPLLPNSQLLTDQGIKFLTDEGVTVPAGGSLQIGATAAEPGRKYNIGPARFNFIRLSPSLQSLVYAESKEAATGGERVVNAATNADIKKAQDELISELEAQAQEELRGKTKPTEQFVPEAVIKKVLDKSATVDPNEETTAFAVTATVQLKTVVFDENSLLQLSIAKLTASLKEGLELASYNPKTFNYEVASFDADKGTATLKARLKGVARPRLGQDFFDKSKVAGKGKTGVADFYRSLKEIDHVETRFMPPFIQSVPTIVDKITIILGKSSSLQDQTPVEPE